MFYCFFFEWYGDHRNLHVLTHSFPTRRSSDLARRVDEDDDQGTVVGQRGDQRAVIDGGEAAVTARRQGDAADRQALMQPLEAPQAADRKSTRLNSSH